MKQLSDRVLNISPSQTLVIDTLAKKLQREGQDIVSFSAGEPDFATPENVVQKAKLALNNPLNFKYSAVSGLLELKDAIVQKQNSILGENLFSRDNVLVTNGGKQAVFEIFATLLNQGDEIILPKPYWLTYPEVAHFFNARVNEVEVENILDGSYQPSQTTKAILINSPNNPSGRVYSVEELKIITDFAIKHDLYLISDEIYKFLYYEGDGLEVAPTPLSVNQDILDRLIIIDGVAKFAAMTGWRVGWIIANKNFIKRASSLQSHLTSNVNNIAQIAASEAVLNSDDTIIQMKRSFQNRRDLIVSLLKKVSNNSGDKTFKLDIPQGAFYVFVNVQDYLNDDFEINSKNGQKTTVFCKNASDFASLLLEEVGVAVVPMDSFGTPGFIRFSYALGEEDIDKGISKIINLLKC